MAPDKIEECVEQNKRKEFPLHIHFKRRGTITGLFIQGVDYKELKSKNLWRIVSGIFPEEWKQTKNQSLARIFIGLEITRIPDIY